MTTEHNEIQNRAVAETIAQAAQDTLLFGARLETSETEPVSLGEKEHRGFDLDVVDTQSNATIASYYVIVKRVGG